MSPPPLPQDAGQVVIAVLDSGVHFGHPHLRGALPVPGFAVEGDGSLTDQEIATDDVQGHGTAVAAAILARRPGARLMPVRVLDRDLRASSPCLAAGIVEAARRGARVLNLSLGSEAPDGAARLARAIAQAAALGAVAVAAAAPLPRSSWPADLPGVIGVRWDEDCPPGAWFSLDEDLLLPGGGTSPLARFAAHGRPRPAEGRDPRGNFAGASLACAPLTAAAAACLDAEPGLSFAGLVTRLREGATGPLPAGHRLR
ncbi:S8 family serine peptidase [Myxococcota bacterium]|nr:S8 family serine peptidase [Myxococcota bacterium]